MRSSASCSLYSASFEQINAAGVEKDDDGVDDDDKEKDGEGVDEKDEMVSMLESVECRESVLVGSEFDARG
jgi:hypothetical protein